MFSAMLKRHSFTLLHCILNVLKLWIKEIFYSSLRKNVVIGTEDQTCDDQFETASTGIKPLSTSELPLIQRETHRDTNASLYNLQD